MIIKSLSKCYGIGGLRLGYHKELARCCELTQRDRDALYWDLGTIAGLTAYRPDANFLLRRLPDGVISGPELTRRLFIEDNILVKHCAGKTMPEADRYVRIASRTEAENQALIEALLRIIGRSRAEKSASLSRS